jgi:hypothetical protein
MPDINFSELTRGEVTSLAGHERGLEARRHFRLDDLDWSPDAIRVVAPQNLDALTPSFVQGLFATSVHRLGDQFFSHYRFEVSPEILSDIRVGIQRAQMRREIAGAHEIAGANAS